MRNRKIPKDFIEQVISSTDIIDVISQSISLKKQGEEYIACCPFHNEKTPSFHVNQKKQIYNCFGCNASGNVITFMREYENLDFIAAIEELSSMQGLEIPYESSTDIQSSYHNPNELYKTLMTAAKFYRWQLKFHKNSDQVIRYIKTRNISSATAKQYLIGYAPNEWATLTNLLQTNHGIENLIRSGLTIKKEPDRVFDRFRDRLLFPIRNRRGNIIGFGGRRLSVDKNQPKYLNSPETDIFHKSDELYGLYEIKQIIKQPRHILVVEGYMDVIALSEHGYNTAVATLGTSLTEKHIKNLFRETNTIIFCFDGDKAGQDAALKAAKISLQYISGEKSANFIQLPTDEDPDTLINKIGLNSFQKLVESSFSLIDFIFNHIPSSENNIALLIDFISGLIKGIPETSYVIQIKNLLTQKTGANLTQINNIIQTNPQTQIPPANRNVKPRTSSLNIQNLTYIESTLYFLLSEPTLFDNIIQITYPIIKDPTEASHIILNALYTEYNNRIDKMKISTASLLQAVITLYPDYESYLYSLLSANITLDKQEMLKEVNATLKKLHYIEDSKKLNSLLIKSKSYPLNLNEKKILKKLLHKKQNK